MGSDGSAPPPLGGKCQDPVHRLEGGGGVTSGCYSRCVCQPSMLKYESEKAAAAFASSRTAGQRWHFAVWSAAASTDPR